MNEKLRSVASHLVSGAGGGDFRRLAAAGLLVIAVALVALGFAILTRSRPSPASQSHVAAGVSPGQHNVSDPPLPPARPLTDSAPTPSPTPLPKELALESFSCDTDSQSITCTGTVKNLTDQPLENVGAVVEFHDSSLKLLTQDAAAIAASPLLPGQTANWTVVATWDPAFVYERVLFVALNTGDLYPLRDDTG